MKEPVNSQEKSGGISVGRMTGGAVASGPGARAEDRSERVGAPPAAAGDVPVAGPVPENGGVAVGEMSGGAAAAGVDAHALDASRQLLPVPPGLLEAVGLLRQDLPRLARAGGDRLDEVDGELAALEDEARRTGRTERGRLDRLKELLAVGTTAAGALSSAVAVVQAITQLLA
ncbi:hypothetical protein AB0K09_24900 [Streptomyces sp. NPDC049577]|uniref:hypothetical protein n=1 Tax=Streptomyces sp. NPDC049577 TaxID=3155153 RepID=UPI00344258C0